MSSRTKLYRRMNLGTLFYSLVDPVAEAQKTPLLKRMEIMTLLLL